MDNFKDYFSKYAGDYAKSKSHRNGEDLSTLIRLIKPQSDWLVADLASGTGFTAIEIAPHVSKVFAVDGTDAMLKKAEELAKERGANNISFVTAMVEQTGLDSGSCDLVTCRRAAHHFFQKDTFLREAKRILKESGKLALIDMVRPEHDSRDIRNTMERYRDHSHVDAPSVSQWKELFTRGGFRIDSLTSTKELIKFEDFLSPVKPDSKEGLECRSYLKSLPVGDMVSADINPDDFSIIKERVIFICSPRGV